MSFQLCALHPPPPSSSPSSSSSPRPPTPSQGGSPRSRTRSTHAWRRTSGRETSRTQKKQKFCELAFFCSPSIQETHRYLCNDEAEVICLHGWREPEDEDLRWLIPSQISSRNDFFLLTSTRDVNNPCPEPVCEVEGETCAHGDCVRPDVCACQVGGTPSQDSLNFYFSTLTIRRGLNVWSSKVRFSQNLKSLFSRTFFSCFSLHSDASNLLFAQVGWEGHLCNRCLRLPGCQHGNCSAAFECNCETDDEGEPMWTGAYCDCRENLQ